MAVFVLENHCYLYTQFLLQMKNNLFRIYLLGFFILSDFIVFAQAPGSNNDTGNLEDEETPQAPINGKIVWLLILGIAYAAYSYKKHRKTA